jgi:hypothetical protein
MLWTLYIFDRHLERERERERENCKFCVQREWKQQSIANRGKSPNMGRCIISYQEVLSSLLMNVNHQTDEAGPCNHSINSQLLRTSVQIGHLCFGALWNFCLSLNCDSWAVEGKLFFWISLVQSSLLSVILNTCFGSLVEFYVLLFYSPIFLSTCLRLLWGGLMSLIWGSPY